MKTGTRTEELNRLFDKHKKPDWVEDGFFHEELWEVACPRVLYLLKEPNEDKNGTKVFSVVRKSRAEAQPLDWDGWKETGLWTYAIRHTTSDKIPPYAEAESEEDGVSAWMRARHTSAVMNFKKTPGSPPTRLRTLEDLLNVNGYVCFLRRQLEILEPNIVVCGGVCDGQSLLKIAQKYLMPDKTMKECSDKCFLCGGKLWIDSFHPKIHKPIVQMYERIGGVYQTFLRCAEASVVIHAWRGEGEQGPLC